MKNPSTISSGESDERAAFEAHMRRTFPGLELALGNDGVYRIWRVENDWMLWQARAALATQPAESKACASVGVGPALARACDLLSMTIGTLMSHRAKIGYVDNSPIASVVAEAVEFLAPWPEKLPTTASPAPSVGEPEIWMKKVSAGVSRIDHSFVGVWEWKECDDEDPDAVAFGIIATPPAAPAATEAPSKPFAYYIHIAAEQRGEFVHDLDEALDDLTNCECKITELFDHATPAPAVGASPEATPAPGAPGQEAAEDRQIVATYEKLHEGKLGAHWLWCVIEQIAAGVPEAEAMRGFGYYEPTTERSFAMSLVQPHVSRIGIGFPDQAPATQEAAAVQAVAQETDRDWSKAQDWKGMDGATAFLLINRHSDGWGDVGAMMNAWLAANAAGEKP